MSVPGREKGLEPAPGSGGSSWTQIPRRVRVEFHGVYTSFISLGKHMCSLYILNMHLVMTCVCGVGPPAFAVLSSVDIYIYIYI